MTILGIISADRAGDNVARMEQVCHGLNPFWIVPEDQVGDYAYAGAADVLGVPERNYLGRCRLPVQRNFLLDTAAEAGELAAQIDDDLRVGASGWETGIRWVRGDEVPEPITLNVALTLMDAEGADLAGVAVTTNPYFFSPKRPVSAGFCASKLTLMDPVLMSPVTGQLIRYDTKLPVKEDYDLTMQFLAGGYDVARLNGVLCNFASGIRGGCATYRTLDLEREVSAMLVERWSPHIKLNPKRDGEVLLKWKS